MKKYFACSDAKFCVSTFFIFHFLLFNTLSAQLTLVVSSYPNNTVNPDSSIFIAGTFNGWNANDATKLLKKNADGFYSITINPPIGRIEYKYTQKNWSPAEGNNNGAFMPNRVISYDGTATKITDKIESWEGQSTSNSTAALNVQVLTNNFSMPQLGRTRRIWIYLPPNYNTTSQRYPVFYLHDGQNLFDKATSFAGEWQIDESLNKLFDLGDKGCIVVGIDNGGSTRIDEYSPFKNSSYGGGEGAAYTKFLVNTLKPYIDNNFRTLSDRKNTAIGGSSMGGLISAYAACAYPAVYSKVLVFSPAFWFSDSCLIYTKQHVPNSSTRWYFDAGTTESAAMIFDMKNISDALRTNSNNDIQFISRADGQHSEWFWAREFPDAYNWLFRSETTSNNQTQDVKLRIYPNPVDSILNVETNENADYWNAEVFDNWGRQLIFTNIVQNSIDVSQLKSGTYFLKIKEGVKVIYTSQFVKK